MDKVQIINNPNSKIESATRHVCFGYYFNESIILPDHITHITFGYHFNKQLNIPASVHYLSMNYKKNNGQIPETVESLVLVFKKMSPRVFPIIPHSVKNLHLTGDFNDFFTGLIPNSVTHLTFGPAFNKPLGKSIPLSVTHLTFGRNYNQSLELESSFFSKQSVIPESVTHLTFGYYFTYPVKNLLPSSITHLKFGKWFNQSLYFIPESVTHLTLDPVLKNRVTQSVFDYLISVFIIDDKIIIPSSVKRIKFE